MDPEAKVLAADALAGAAPVVALATGIAPANVAEDPIHAVLRAYGVALLAACMTFINVEGLDSLPAFTQLNRKNSDTTEMAKRMATRLSASSSVIIGAMQIKMRGVIDHDKRGLVAQLELWDNEAMIKAMEHKEASQTQ
jgi:hypothetical protein